jgi:hypothetical protein
MRCAAITQAGERCRLEATTGSYCWNHAPENAEARKKRARRGGKSGGNGRGGLSELAGLKTQLGELTEEVLAGDLETGRAAVANQLINTRLRAIELERKIRETEELEARVEALEQPQEGGRQWGT